MRYKAFTLAEVLITLVIIGVVAALAIPSVITNYKEKELETRNNKAKSALTNGIKLLLSNDGVTTLKDSKIMSCETDDKICVSEQMKRAFNVILDNNSTNDVFNKKYNFVSGSQEVWTDSSIKYAFVTSDGIIFGVTPNKDNNSLIVIVDLNGSKNPNKGAEDLSKYTLTNNLTIYDQRSDMADWERTLDMGECTPSTLSKCNKEQCEAIGYIWYNRAGVTCGGKNQIFRP